MLHCCTIEWPYPYPTTVPVIPITPPPVDPYGYYWRSYQSGWICPKCGKVWAPFVPACPCDAVRPLTTDNTKSP